MNINNITEYADFLFSLALYKCGNTADAQDLVQDTLLAAMSAKKPISDPKAWLTAVLNRKYYGLLRRKYNKPAVSYELIGDIPENGEVYDNIEQSAEAESVRRCIAYLAGLYRETVVRYYMHGEKVKDIAAALGISENTVKSRLDAGRKRIGKEISMENYAKQSYEPETLYLTDSGGSGIDGEPFSLVGGDRIAMNLLILAYEKPVTVTELAKAIGIPTAYIEPIVDKLVNGELMKRTGDKVYTDFIIFTEEDRHINFSLQKQIAEDIYKNVWEIMRGGFDELHSCGFYKRQTPSQRAKLDSFFTVRTLLNSENIVRNEISGGLKPFDKYPDRPNGGSWFAFGNRYPANYDYSSPAHEYGKYCISGEARYTHSVDCVGMKKHELTLCEYNSLLGEAQIGDCGKLKRRIEEVEIGQMLYAIHSGKEEQLPLINAGCFENFDIFIEKRYLARDGERVVCDVPVIADSERHELYGLCERYDKIIAEKFHGEFIKLLKNPVKIPPHLKSVPGWFRYMWHCNSLPMLIAEKAKDSGLFPECADYPAPAMLLSVNE